MGFKDLALPFSPLKPGFFYILESNTLLGYPNFKQSQTTVSLPTDTR